MHVLVVSCSQRDNSNSSKVAQLIRDKGFSDIEGVEVKVLNLSDYPNLMENFSAEAKQSDGLAAQRKVVREHLRQCDAIAFVVPEWGGMMPPATLNLLLVSARGLLLAHKPAFAVGVSASGGGTYPIAMLRGFAAKNSHLAWIPLHAIVQNVEDFLATEWNPAGSGRIHHAQSRLTTGLKCLCIYAEKLRDVRANLVALSEIHPYGQ